MIQPSLSEIEYGEYTPTITIVSNLDSAIILVGSKFKFTKIGNIVDVTGSLTLDATAGASTLTEIEISLPFVSNITNQFNVNGVSLNFSNTENGVIYGQVANDTAFLRYFAVTTSAINHHVRFRFEIK